MGGIFTDKKGYKRYTKCKKLVHRALTKAKPGQHVHHIDGNKGNFRRGNLKKMTPSAHGKLHAKKRRAFW